MAYSRCRASKARTSSRRGSSASITRRPQARPDRHRVPVNFGLPYLALRPIRGAVIRTMILLRVTSRRRLPAGQGHGRRLQVKVCVTGASGRAGRAVVVDLHDHGYHVLGTDIAPEPESAPVTERADFIYADLLDFGQAVEIMAGVDAVIHLANIPAPGLRAPAVTFNENMTMNFNVFQAATRAGVRRVVWASSETTLGLPFDVPPRYAPVDEDHFPLPTSTYALSKVATETIAGHISQWSGIPFVALRFSNIMQPADYEEMFPGF